MNYPQLLWLALPEAHVVLTALVVLTLGLTSKRARSVCTVVAVIGLILSAVGVLRAPHEASFLGGMLVVSPLNSLFKIICLSLAAFTIVLAQAESSPGPNHAEYLAIILLATLGLLLLVGSEELLMIFIGLELTGLSLYVMTAFDKRECNSAEAGLKYFLFGSMASAFTLFGLSFIYGVTGTTGLAAIAQKLSATAMQPLLALGIVMTLVGFAFKIAAAPFHLWAADAYQGGPIASSAFIASGSKVASFVVLGKIVLLAFAPLHGSANWHAMTGGWAPMLAALAACSILIGNLVALAQKNVRRLLAYSAVAHAGYTLLGLVAGGRDGFSATLFYTTIYAVTLLGAFGVVGVVRRETGGDDLTNFRGLATRSPLLAACMAIFMLSLAGLPPLAGFFGKFYLFSAAFRAGGNHGLLWLVVLALFGSFISLYYYLIILKVVFTDESTPPATTGPVGNPLLQRCAIATLAGAVVVLGVLPQVLVARILAALP